MEPIRVLTSNQMEMIDETARTILEQTGMAVQCDEALSHLERFGCIVDRSTYRVKFPRVVTDAAIQKMRADYQRPGRPERMPVRFSHVRFRPVPYQVHADFTASAGGFCCFLHDLDGRRRAANADDVLRAINMVNNLDEIDLTGLPVSDQTVPAPHRPVAMAALLAKYTKKLGGIETFCKDDVRPIYEIGQLVAGAADNYRRQPPLVGYAEVRSPLCFDRNMAEIFMEYVKLGVPQTVDTMPAGGSTAPITGAGVLALGAAETIGAMVLGYAVRDDAVLGIDITPSYTDMVSGLYKYSGAERCQLLMARVQLLADYYGCPTGVHGGKTNSCFYNEQTGAEKMSSMLLPILAGAVGIGTLGHLENAVTFSPVQLVIDSEMIRYVRRIVAKPMAVTPATLAADVVNAVGPGGNYLEADHTAEHFRDELLFSPLFPTHTWDYAHAHSEDFDTVAKARTLARDLWKKPQAMVLSDDKVREIDKIVKRATAR